MGDGGATMRWPMIALTVGSASDADIALQLTNAQFAWLIALAALLILPIIGLVIYVVISVVRRHIDNAEFAVSLMDRLFGLIPWYRHRSDKEYGEPTEEP